MTDDTTYRDMKQRALAAEAECERLRAEVAQFNDDLRDHFAGLALQGMLSNPALEWGNPLEAHPVDAYLIADAMLEARKVKP